MEQKQTNNSIQQGMVVRSESGHDCGSFYVVVRLAGDFAYIADGRRRKLHKPKRKNCKHLAQTSRIVEDLPELDTDKKIRRILWSYNFGSANPVAE